MQMYFSQKRVSETVRQLIERTTKAAVQQGLDPNRLYVGMCIVPCVCACGWHLTLSRRTAHAYVGRNTPLKRIRYHSQSRMGRVHKPRTRLTIVLEEVSSAVPDRLRCNVVLTLSTGTPR